MRQDSPGHPEVDPKVTRADQHQSLTGERPCVSRAAQFPRGLRNAFWFSALARQLWRNSHRRSVANSWLPGKSSRPTETQQKVESTARAHGMPVELLAGTWGILMKTFQDKYGGASSHPKSCQLSLTSSRLFYAAQMVSLDTENRHRLANPDSHSQHIVMLFDGSTIRPKRRLMSSIARRSRRFPCKKRNLLQTYGR